MAMMMTALDEGLVLLNLKPKKLTSRCSGSLLEGERFSMCIVFVSGCGSCNQNNKKIFLNRLFQLGKSFMPHFYAFPVNPSVNIRNLNKFCSFVKQAS